MKNVLQKNYLNHQGDQRNRQENLLRSHQDDQRNRRKNLLRSHQDDQRNRRKNRPSNLINFIQNFCIKLQLIFCFI